MCMAPIKLGDEKMKKHEHCSRKRKFVQFQ